MGAGTGTGTVAGRTTARTAARPATARPAAGRSRSAGPPVAGLVAALALVGTLVVGQLYATIPLLPRLGAAWGVPGSTATWATSAFAAPYAVVSLLSGQLARRYGTRAVAVTGVVVLALATACVPFGGGLAAGLALRAVQGAGAGVYVPMAYACLNARVAPARLPFALTVVSACMAGTVVTGQLESQLLASLLGWRGVFLAWAPLLLLGAAVLHRTLPADRPGRSAAVPAARPAIRPVRLLPLYLAALLCSTGMTAVYTGLQLYGPPALVRDDQAMLALRATALPALLTAVLLAPLLGRVPAPRRATAGFALAALGALGTAATGRHTGGLALALAVFMLGVATVGPALVQHLGARTTGTPNAPTAMALYGFTLNIGGALGAQLPKATATTTGLGCLLATLLTTCAALLATHRTPP
ncbi:putative major facilitator superfamily transporter [Kitasatospora setae KM-6054]|uniref:Putative major facilitator superfamily transporter n=1 Tax=Kitasatospora setae (strain ATCC 33774 / DSM 43861 / JCM 3304 / KCC A-0304 / NBRC 14216 / KM-6054) TaxID=452652 RepID=E4N0G1_KITSK|nr:putative major facilitator superfamily transporter [Kitasatospora setae KM-6054]